MIEQKASIARLSHIERILETIEIHFPILYVIICLIQTDENVRIFKTSNNFPDLNNFKANKTGLFYFILF
jgi:hypothetical protein